MRAMLIQCCRAQIYQFPNVVFSHLALRSNFTAIRLEKRISWWMVREGWLYQIGCIFGKVPKGGGIIADFGNFKQGFDHEIDTI